MTSDGEVIVIRVTDAFETIAGDISELGAETSLEINKTIKYYTFIPEINHSYTFTLSGSISSKKYIYVYDREKGTTAIASKNATANSVMLTTGLQMEAGKEYIVGLKKNNNTVENVTIIPTLGTHDYGTNHVCVCGALEPWSCSSSSLANWNLPDFVGNLPAP